MASQALRLARRAWNSTDHEWKVQEDAFVDVVIAQPSTSVAVLMNGIASGVDQDDRIGEQAVMQRLQFRLVFQKDPNNAAPSTTVRIIVVWDKQTNGGLAASGNVLESVNVGVIQDRNIHSMRNAQTRKRFSFILDKTLTLNDGLNQDRVVNWNLNLKRRKAQYNGAGAGIANINTGSLLFFVMGSITDGGAQSLYTGQSRLWYIG